MTSILRTRIVEQYNLYNHQKLNTQDIKKISKERNIEEKDLLNLFEVSQVASNKCLKGIDCNFYITIYSPEEFQEIKEKIRKELAQFSRANGKMLELFKQKYRISSKDMRVILNAKYQSYKNAEEQNGYLKLTWQEDKKKTEKVSEKDSSYAYKKLATQRNTTCQRKL